MHENFKVGQYTLERRLGEGGMAEVWEARHIHLGSYAAVKFLLPRLAGDPELEDRFLNEGKRQAQLKHPNIVGALDFVQQDGRSYLIMQFVQGENLDSRIRQQNGPLGIEEVRTISWDVLSALDYAHSVGVVHRDVKPSNILIDETGRVWLTDFGIALALREERRVTRTGISVGTPDYMSPEQIIRPKEVDARTDVYSFGCVLYAMLSGGPPFGMDGATEFHIKDCHVRTPPPPMVYRNPGINPAVERVVLRCLEKEPAKRFQSCGLVMNALETAIAEGASPASPPAVGTAPVAAQGLIQGPVRHPTRVEAQAPPTPVSAAARGAVTPPPITQPAIAPGAPLQAIVPPRKPNKKRGFLVTFVATVLLAAAAVAYFLFFLPPDAALSLEGSTTVGNELVPRLLIAFLKSEGATDIEELPAGTGDNKGHHDVRAKLPGHWRPQLFSVLANGSGNAFKALDANRANVGMASRAIKDDEVSKLARFGDMRSSDCEYVLALDGIAVIVNRANPVQALTRQQLGSIFRGSIDNWAQVGGRSAPIVLYGRDSESGTYDTFVSLVMTNEKGNKQPFKPGLNEKTDGDAIAQAVADDPNAIGYVGLAQVGSANKLQISAGPGTVSLFPSEFTVATEDYILSRRLFLYLPANPAPSEMTRRFVKFALSPEGQSVVKDVHYVEQIPHFEEVPIPADAPPLYRQKVQGLRRMNLNFRFKPNGKELDNKAIADISRALGALKLNQTSAGVEVLGFADSTPGDNQRLSEERAEVIASQLRANGIKVEASGFSSAMPVRENSTEDGRQKNRRVEIWAK